MYFGCTYLKVKDMKESINFYSKLLQMKPTFKNRERWVMFSSGNTLALYNQQFDLEKLSKNETIEKHYNKNYLEYLKRERAGCSKGIVLNFHVADLNEEYERLKKLNIGKISKIMYVNITNPYWFFIVEDPDGNEIEIEGNYIEGK